MYGTFPTRTEAHAAAANAGYSVASVNGKMVAVRRGFPDHTLCKGAGLDTDRVRWVACQEDRPWKITSKSEDTVTWSFASILDVAEWLDSDGRRAEDFLVEFPTVVSV